MAYDPSSPPKFLVPETSAENLGRVPWALGLGIWINCIIGCGGPWIWRPLAMGDRNLTKCGPVPDLCRFICLLFYNYVVNMILTGYVNMLLY